MANYTWEIKVYDVSGSKWISGIEQDLINQITVTRAVSESTGEFIFDFDVDTSAIDSEDIIILNVGEYGSSMSRWFIGRIERSNKKADEEDIYHSIEGKGIDKILLTGSAPEATFTSTQQQDVVKSIVGEITYSPSTTWVSNEPIYIEQRSQWQDLCVDEVISGNWTLRYNDIVRTYGTDYAIDTGTVPPRGRIKIIADDIQIGDYAYFTYQTDRALPYGKVVSNERQIRVTTSGVYAETQTIDINVSGFDMLGALQDACMQTSIPYDFYLSPSLDLVSQCRNSGTVRTAEYDEVDDLTYYDDSTYVINETLVKQAGGGNYEFWPDPIDAITEFAGNPAADYWSAMGATYGVFGLVAFSATSSDGEIYGGKFIDDWDHTPTLTAATAGVKVGSNYLRASTTTPVYSMRVQNEFQSTIIAFGNVNVRHLLNMFEYGNPSAPTVMSYTMLGTDLDNYVYREWELRDAFGTDYTVFTTGWLTAGSVNYSNINYLSFLSHVTPGSSPITMSDMELNIDGLYFGRYPIEARASDTVSQGLYGVRKSNGMIPYPVIDNTITTLAEAQQRANAIIAQYKDPTPILESVIFTDGRLDLNPGDKLQLESWVSGSYFPTTRVVSVTHTIEDADIQTTIECKSNSPVGIESYMQELEIEIRRLEMREL